MIPEYHLYHGAVLASLLSGTGQSVTVRSPESQRPAEYILDDRIGLYVKHATQRLRPWHFGFTSENIDTIRAMNMHLPDSFLILVCKQDGALAVNLDLVLENISSVGKLWIRVDRSKRKHYSVHGPLGEFPRKFDSRMLEVKSLLAGDQRRCSITARNLEQSSCTAAKQV